MPSKILIVIVYYRAKKENQFVVCIIKGPKKPKDIYSFLYPLLMKLIKMESAGVIVKAHDNQKHHIKVYTCLFLGDIPAMADTLFHTGHTSKYGCRICDIMGSSNDGKGMYFSHKNLDNAVIRSNESFKSVDERVSGVNATTILVFGHYD